MTIMKFRKKPVVIEAVQWNGLNKEEIIKFTNELAIISVHYGGGADGQGHPQIYTKLVIPTLEGDHIAQEGDWIIKGIKGEFYPCKSDIFMQTYEKVE